MRCLSNLKIRQYIDNQLAEKALNKIDIHLKICEKCWDKVQLDEERTIQFKNTIKTLYPQEIPKPDTSFLREKEARQKKFIQTRVRWAMAALLLVAVFISLSFLFRQSLKHDNNVRAMISAVRINGNPAKPVIFSSTKPEMTIFWIEKDN